MKHRGDPRDRKVAGGSLFLQEILRGSDLFYSWGDFSTSETTRSSCFCEQRPTVLAS